MAITSLHQEIPFLLKIHIEAIILSVVLLNTTLSLFFFKKEQDPNNTIILAPIILGLLFIISPLITSLINQDHLLVLQDEEYKDLFKTILFGPCLFYFLHNIKYKKTILNSVIFSYVIFSFYFLYRFLILKEVRDFDLRPLLKIRHGDANFLCTFFSMMIPIPLMEAWSAKNKKQIFQTIIYLLASFLFFLCAFLTQSRMGIIAILIGIIYLLTRPIWSTSRKIVFPIFLMCSILFVVLNGEKLLLRYADIQDKSNSDRYLTWKNGWQVFQDNPIVGVGIHKARDFFYQNTGYPPFQSEFKPLEVHNTFLKAAAELGVTGLLFFLLLFFWPWKKSFKLISQKKYFLLSSMGILTISIMTIGLLYKDLFILHLFIIAALAYPHPTEDVL
jgi:O-antigen ligase